jgi:hypothetical protein
MPYVMRDTDGAVTSLHRSDPGSGEVLATDHPDVVAFLGVGFQPLSEFERLDVDFVRVLEDVIEALTARNVINITDLPENALAKLLARRSYRERQSSHALQLFAEGTEYGELGQNTII